MKTKWDLSHIYINIDEWEKELIVLKNKIVLITQLSENFIRDSQKFYEFLILKGDIDLLIEKTYCYARRHLDIDSTLINYKDMVEQVLDIHSQIQLVYNNFEKTVIANADIVKKYLQEERFKLYRRYISLIIRRKQHIITSDQSILICAECSKNIYNLRNQYQALFSNEIEFTNIEIDGVLQQVNRSNYNDLILNRKQNNRKIIYDAYTNAYKKANYMISDIYISKLKNDIKVAKLEKYSSLLEKKLFELELSNDILDNLIKVISKNIHVMHQYTNLRKKLSGLEEYHVYDTPISICKYPKIQYELESSIKLIKNGLKPLGNDYIALIDKMFVEGWVDVYPEENKRTMSFTCISYIGVPYILINYNRSIDSVRTLAHEIGHAAHVYYSKQNNDFVNFEFSFFLTEIASKVNEILVNEYMLQYCHDNEEKKYILNNIISSMGNSLFGQVMLTEFEHDIINKINRGETVDYNYLNQLYSDLSQKYNGSSLSYDDNIKYGWSKVPHLIMQDTYYLYQYSIGTAIAVNIAYRILDNEPNIIAKYKKFLSCGNSVSVAAALNYIDINLASEKYMDDVLQILENKISQLGNLFIV